MSTVAWADAEGVRLAMSDVQAFPTVSVLVGFLPALFTGLAVLDFHRYHEDRAELQGGLTLPLLSEIAAAAMAAGATAAEEVPDEPGDSGSWLSDAHALRPLLDTYMPFLDVVSAALVREGRPQSAQRWLSHDLAGRPRHTASFGEDAAGTSMRLRGLWIRTALGELVDPYDYVEIWPNSAQQAIAAHLLPRAGSGALPREVWRTLESQASRFEPRYVDSVEATWSWAVDHADDWAGNPKAKSGPFNFSFDLAKLTAWKREQALITSALDGLTSGLASPLLTSWEYDAETPPNSYSEALAGMLNLESAIGKTDAMDVAGGVPGP